MPNTTRFLPNLDRISVLAATILLAYTLTGLISIPTRQFAAQLPGFYFEIQLNVQTVISLLVTALAVSGTNWLLSEHPSAPKRNIFQHWLIPGLTAWVIGIPLYQKALGQYWWLGILLGGGILILVLATEYIVIDPEDAYYTVASISLTAVAFSLFFLLAVILRAMQLRLYLITPALTLAIALVSLRTLDLNLKGQRFFPAIGICTVVTAELTMVAHYLPLSPIAFGLFLLGPAYSLVNFSSSLANQGLSLSKIIESALVVILFWTLAWWFR